VLEAFVRPLVVGNVVVHVVLEVVMLVTLTS
jgi:hypothetical protein